MPPTNNPAIAGCNQSVHDGSFLTHLRSMSSQPENPMPAKPPVTPSTAYATNSRGSRKSTYGMRNIASVPKKNLATATLDMVASTIDISTEALQLPITSSITNTIAEIGALNAAPKPAA